MKIGFIGLGHMGAPMAANLVRAGLAVTGYDTSEVAARRLREAGGHIAASASAAAVGADIVITMLPNGPVVDDVLFGPGGVASAMSSSSLFVDMSTIAPTASDMFRRRLADRGVAMVDAPVGRTAAEAVTGELLIMMGGMAADLAKATPAFRAMGTTLVDCGGPGTGVRMKLINNYMTTVLNVLTAEALTLADRSGIAQAVAIEVLRGTAAGRGHINTTYPNKVLKGDVTPSFMIDLASKDLGLALDLASDVRVPAVTGAAARQVYSIARAAGQGREDWTAILNTVGKLAR